MKNNGSLGLALVVSVLLASTAQGAPGNLKWSFPTDAPVVSSAAIGVDGTIYFGSANLASSALTHLYAVNPDGTEKWRFPTGDIRRAPTVAVDGTIYAVTGDDQLIAVDPQGNGKWIWAAADIADSSAAVGYDGTIYVRAAPGVLHAVNSDGTEYWSVTFDDVLTTSPVIGPDGTVYVGCADSNLYAINPDGTEKWRFSAGGYVHSAPAIRGDGTLFFGMTNGRFYRVAPDGFLEWEFTDAGPFPQTPVIGCSQRIYFGNDGGVFHEMTSAGNHVWSREITASWSAAAIGADCTIYVTRDDQLLAFNHDTHAIRWRFDLDDDADTFPVIGIDDTLYIGSHDGALYAIEAQSAGPKCSGWPMARHDARGAGLGMGLTARTLGGVLHDAANSIEQTPDCGYIVAGATHSFGTGSTDSWIVKLDAAGRVEWERTYGADGIAALGTIRPTSDGGFIACGATDIDSGAGQADAWVVKLDRVGEIAWQGTYGGVNDDALKAVLELDDGYLVAGATQSWDTLTRDDAWVLRLDANGTLVQQRLYGVPLGGEGAADIQPTPDGGFIFTGPTFSFGAGNGDAWVVKLNADLSVAWERVYGGPEPDFAAAVRPISDGTGYYVGGTTSTSAPLDRDAWLMKLDLAGDIVWQRSFPDTGHETLLDFELLPGGDVVMVGLSETPIVPPVSDAWIARVNLIGDMNWRHTFSGAELEGVESFASVAVTSQGDYVVAGQTDSIGFGDSEMLLLRVERFGDEPAECGVLEDGTPVATPTTFVSAVTTSTHGFSSASVAATAVTPGASSGVMMDVCNPWMVTVDLPRTGQVTSYATGDDGHVQAGVAWPEPRFTDNGDGTVLDNLTGLVWLEDANCFEPQSWEAGLSTVSDFNANPGSYSCVDYSGNPDADWRVPNYNELETLINAEAMVQSDWLIAQGFANVQPEWYWSSGTGRPQNALYAWIFDMDRGQTGRTLKTSLRQIWPVRGGQQNYVDLDYPVNVPKTGTVESDHAGDDGELRWGVAWPHPRLSDLGDGTVIDNLTGLIWLQDSTCLGQLNWEGALAAVATLNAAGGTCGQDYDDWTVPNRKQMLSLIDRAERRPVLPTGHPFSTVPAHSTWWTSTANTRQGTTATPAMWAFDLWFGEMESIGQSSDYSYVLPVRVPGGFDPVVAGLSEGLSIERAGTTDITLTWSGSCLASDTDFAIYEGTVGDFTSHVPLQCSTGGNTTVTFESSPGDTYYLVVPLNASVEGSYGVDDAGTERPPSTAACRTHSVGECPP